jgi:hypothetical protein
VSTEAAAAPRAPFQPEAALASYLVVAGQSADWGLDAGRVVNVLPERIYEGPAPIALDASLGIVPKANDEGSRVLLVKTDSGQQVAVRVAGRTQLRMIERSQVMPLPRIVLTDEKERLLSGVVLVDGQLPLFIVKVDSLSADAAGR